MNSKKKLSGRLHQKWSDRRKTVRARREVEKVGHAVKENIESRKIREQTMQELYKKTNSMNNKYKEGE